MCVCKEKKAGIIIIKPQNKPLPGVSVLHLVQSNALITRSDTLLQVIEISGFYCYIYYSFVVISRSMVCQYPLLHISQHQIILNLRLSLICDRFLCLHLNSEFFFLFLFVSLPAFSVCIL